MEIKVASQLATSIVLIEKVTWVVETSVEKPLNKLTVCCVSIIKDNNIPPPRIWKQIRERSVGEKSNREEKGGQLFWTLVIACLYKK